MQEFQKITLTQTKKKAKNFIISFIYILDCQVYILKKGLEQNFSVPL